VLIRVPTAVVVACNLLLAACGGGGGSSGGTVQSIDFPYPGTRYLATSGAPLTATSTSALPVSFSSNTPSICTVSDGNLVPVAAGECSITASQEGDSTYAAATPAQQLFKILLHPQVITFASPGFQDINGTPPPLAATSDSGLAVTFASATPDVCTVSGTTLTLVSRGQCGIIAMQDGDADYAPAPPTTVSFVVGDAPPPVLTFASGYQSTTLTADGGAISTFAGSNKDGWWCTDPNWCSSSVASDGSSFTFTYTIQPSDPKHPNTDTWMGGYAGFQLFAPGVTAFTKGGDTTTGVRIDKQTTLQFSLAEDPTWYGTISSGAHNADVKISMVLGHYHQKSDGSDCNIAVQTVFTPTAASTQAYTLQLASFTSVSESCGMTGLVPATELASYPIVQLKIEASSANTTASTTTPTDPSYPTAITLTGPVTFQ
jgi:hypothetical protein